MHDGENVSNASNNETIFICTKIINLARNIHLSFSHILHRLSLRVSIVALHHPSSI